MSTGCCVRGSMHNLDIMATAEWARTGIQFQTSQPLDWPETVQWHTYTEGTCRSQDLRSQVTCWQREVNRCGSICTTEIGKLQIRASRPPQLSTDSRLLNIYQHLADANKPNLLLRQVECETHITSQ